ncbi:hypothetical protein NKJ55_13080 [Mesorhizobium sp. M0106]|uniref:hypothetical protein n=1 Tax=unclassified Mesorhizobium TaxID=325217 RepID=UPI00333C543E
MPGRRQSGMKRPATQWAKPGLIGPVKHLHSEEGLRNASLLDFWDQDQGDTGHAALDP